MILKIRNSKTQPALSILRLEIVQKRLSWPKDPENPTSYYSWLYLQTVDRQKGLASSSAKKNRCETRDQQLKYELRTTIKAAIYRIVLAFGPHIEQVPLPAEHEKRIKSFANFMEG